MAPLKILISAYACRPHQGSEPGVGWNTIAAIAPDHQIWVLTRRDNLPSIMAELAVNPMPTVEILPCGLWGERGWKRALPLVHLHYYLWQMRAYFLARRYHRAVGFDVAHHVTYVRYSTPSFLARLPIPLLWGPVGGAEAAPAAFFEDFRWQGKLYEWVRSLAHRCGSLDPFTQQTARRSALARATTEETAIRLRQLGAKRVEVMTAIAIAPGEFAQMSQCPPPPVAPFRLITMARLLHWKGIHLGLRAVAAAGLPEVEYWLVGDGPERSPLAQLAQRLGIHERVKFWGKTTREEAIAHLGQCHVLLHPSLHDSGALVCMEAMAAARPVICLALGGPALQVTPATGLSIPAHNPKQAVQDLAEAIRTLAGDGDLCQRMGAAGQARVQTHYSWSERGQALRQTYRELAQP